MNSLLKAEFLDPRRAAKRLAAFAIVVVCGLAIWPIFGSALTTGFQHVANATVGSMRFGKGGHAEFLTIPEQATANTERDASWNAPVRLSIGGVEKKHVVSVNPRRLLYLPLLGFIALIAAAPLAFSRKLRCIGLGFCVLLLSGLTSVWLIVAWIFSRVPGLVYELEGWQSTLLDFAYEAFVTPMGNKFVLPVILAAGLVLWHLVRDERRTATAAVNTISPIAPKRTPARRRRRRRLRRA